MRTLILIAATLSALAAGCGGDSADPGPSQAEQQAADVAEQLEDASPSVHAEQDADESSESAAEDAVQQTEVEAPTLSVYIVAYLDLSIRVGEEFAEPEAFLNPDLTAFLRILSNFADEARVLAPPPEAAAAHARFVTSLDALGPALIESALGGDPAVFVEGLSRFAEAGVELARLTQTALAAHEDDALASYFIDRIEARLEIDEALRTLSGLFDRLAALDEPRGFAELGQSLDEVLALVEGLRSRLAVLTPPPEAQQLHTDTLAAYEEQLSAMTELADFFEELLLLQQAGENVPSGALAREIVSRLFGAISVDLIPVSGGDRFALLQDGTIDLLIRTTTHFTQREELAAPTSNYFLDGIAITVLADSGPTSLADLDGGTLGMKLGVLAVATGASRESQLQEALTAAGAAVELLDIGDLRTPLDLLDSGQVDGLAWSYLLATTTGRDDLTTIHVSFDDPWALWTASAAFRDEVEEVLLALIEDGTWETLFSQAFGFDAPWTIEEMLGVPAIDNRPDNSSAAAYFAGLAEVGARSNAATLVLLASIDIEGDEPPDAATAIAFLDGFRAIFVEARADTVALAAPSDLVAAHDAFVAEMDAVIDELGEAGREVAAGADVEAVFGARRLNAAFSRWNLDCVTPEQLAVARGLNLEPFCSTQSGGARS